MKPDGPVFDSSWRRSCHIERVGIVDIDEFVQAHYLKKRPAIVLLALAMVCNGEKVGCIIYSAPAMQTEKRLGGKTWELARLYLVDRMPKNSETWLIGQSVKYIKRERSDVMFLVSYADPTAGHDGTIYRAANWRDEGLTEAGRKTPRCAYFDGRTGKKYGRKGNMPADAVIVRRPLTPKHRFVYAMGGHACRS